MKNALATVAILCMVEGSAMADQASFADDAVGATPKGWTATMTGSGKPKWTVEEDVTALSASKVVKQSGRATYPLLLKDGTSLKDGFVEIRFKAISGSEDRAGGIVWRAKDANNYYVVRANALENNVVLYKTVGGKRSSLDVVGQKGGYGVKLPVPAGQWNKFRVEFAGSRFKVVFNDQAAFEVDDRTFSDAGQIGLWTKADSVTAFDGVSYGAE
jgi:3-keto-disaccharide hydrolase